MNMKEFVAVSTISERSRMMQIFEVNDIQYEVKVISDNNTSETSLADYEGIIGNPETIYVFYVAEENMQKAKDLCKYSKQFFNFVIRKAA